MPRVTQYAVSGGVGTPVGAANYRGQRSLTKGSGLGRGGGLGAGRPAGQRPSGPADRGAEPDLAGAPPVGWLHLHSNWEVKAAPCNLHNNEHFRPLRACDKGQKQRNHRAQGPHCQENTDKQAQQRSEPEAVRLALTGSARYGAGASFLSHSLSDTKRWRRSPHT